MDNVGQNKHIMYIQVSEESGVCKSNSDQQHTMSLNKTIVSVNCK